MVHFAFRFREGHGFIRAVQSTIFIICFCALAFEVYVCLGRKSLPRRLKPERLWTSCGTDKSVAFPKTESLLPVHC
jgi:hypothetical protein